MLIRTIVLDGSDSYTGRTKNNRSKKNCCRWFHYTFTARHPLFLLPAALHFLLWDFVSFLFQKVLLVFW